MAGSKTLTTLTAVLQMNNSKFKKGIKGSQKQLTSFQKQVRKVGGLVAGAFAISAVTSFTKSAFRALDTQRKAEAALLTALKGKEDIQRSLIAQAQQLQKVTLYGDEETIRAQSLIAAFTNEEQTIKRLIPLVQDFATAKQMDLAGAADLVSKTIGSSTNALSRYGIAVTGAVGSSERLDSIVNGLSGAFIGQAKAAAEADTSLTQLKNKWGDFKEGAAGFAIALVKPTGALKDLWAATTSKDIAFMDRVQGLFSPAKAAEIAAFAGALKEVREATPGGTAGFFDEEDLGGGGIVPPAPKILSATAMPKDGILDFDVLKVGEGFDYLKEMATGAAEAVAESRLEFEYLSDTLDTFHGVFTATVAPAMDKAALALKATLKDIGQAITMELLNNIHSLGMAMGEMMGGMEGSLKSLAAQILANIGYILMMAGLYLLPLNPAAGVGLMLAGGAIQLGSGIFKGKENAARFTETNQGGGDVNFKIEGNNLVGVLKRNEYKTNMNT